ncbi:uncharacterized protein IL334_007150 [Kwoniella shivajii]|uniref:Uncharacterized protein n=1 Tax=Kwoniella shivajii TaxID=564305 RepID=A0ABZ1D8N2_9TREE|nr:hypothetical protein IL334_007150 [Kwoniella shivajii]
MPPKQSNIHHVTFHFNKSAVLLSVASSTSISSLKTQLLPALKPLSSTLSSLPTSASDIQLWETKSLVEGDESSSPDGVRNLEGDGIGSKTIAQLSWGRWKTLFVSFRNTDGTFSEPVYTIPDVEDEEPDEPES